MRRFLRNLGEFRKKYTVSNHRLFVFKYGYESLARIHRKYDRIDRAYGPPGTIALVFRVLSPIINWFAIGANQFLGECNLQYLPNPNLRTILVGAAWAAPLVRRNFRPIAHPVATFGERGRISLPLA